MAERFEHHDVDVLVIGAGGAGLRAAIEASAQGAKVGVVCKSLLGKAHTVMAEGGVAAALGHVDPSDCWKVHFKDTMLGGKMLNNWRMAQLHAQEAPDRVRELEHWGAVFDRTQDGRILQRNFGGHSSPRLAHVGDRTGLEMIRTLQDHGVHQGLEVYMECTVTRLLTEGGRVVGAFAYWRENGRFITFRAKAVVLATGGIGKAYKITSNSWEYTGDGHALALGVGAELIDMEFFQFHPTGMVWPPGVMGLLVTEAVRGEGGLLRNSKGERFMERYDPKRMELSTRDMVARAIYTEVKEGRGSPHGGAFLDISHKPAEVVKKKLPSMYHQFMEFANIDITKGPMEVGPTGHYIMGGVRVDAETGAATVPGCSPRENPRAACTARTVWAAIPYRISWCTACARALEPRRTRRRQRRRALSTRAGSDRRARDAGILRAPERPGPVLGAPEAARFDAGSGRNLPHRGRFATRIGRCRRSAGRRRPCASRVRAPSTPAGTWRTISGTC